MGLAISRSIVESHDGRLWATSDDGLGATFHFTLPAAIMEVPSKRSTDVPAFGLLQNLARGTCALQWGSRLTQVYASDWRKLAHLPPVESSGSRSNEIRAQALPSPSGPRDVTFGER